MTGSTFSVRLPDDLRREVDQLAKVTKRSRAFVVKEAVEAYVEEQRAYLAVIDEALEEAEHGAFVSGEQVAGWLSSWGEPDEKPAPETDIFLNHKS